MAKSRYQRLIRFADLECDAVIRPARTRRSPPPRSCAKAAARAAADDLYLYGGGSTPELAEVIKRIFRGMHFLA